MRMVMETSQSQCVSVTLIGADGVVVGTTTSDTDGTFVFDGVPLGTYTVVESTRPGFTDVTDSDGGDPNSITVTVAPGVDTVGLEFIDEEPSSGPSASPTAAPTASCNHWSPNY